MTAARAQATQIAEQVYRALDVLEVLDRAVVSGDLLTARYAAATLTELGDQIETALLALDHDAKANRLAVAR